MYQENKNILDDHNEVDENDFNEQFQYSWEDEYFKEFEWLNDLNTRQNKPNEDNSNNAYKLLSLMRCFGVDIQCEPKKSDPVENKLYMYFVSLEEDKMFLYTDFKEDDATILTKSAEKFAYMQTYKPCKIVFTMEIVDFYDVDKYVKKFMHQFGVDNVRGGSYVDITLDDKTIDFIEKEREIACVEYYADTDTF